MAQSVSNDALWVKLSEVDEKLDKLIDEQKSSIPTQESPENKPDFTGVKEDRAIVSDIAGTTRDVIEDVITLNGVMFRFIDTAGIRATDDKVENIPLFGITKYFAEARDN